jgi:signal transduction histidine kinase
LLKTSATIAFSLLIGALAALAILIVSVYTQEQIDSVSKIIIEKKVNEVNLLASRASLRLSDASTIMTITSQLPQVTTLPNSSLVKAKLHGVPENIELGKRFVAKTIMKEYSNYDTVSFLLRNGDVYFVEPYLSQKNITLNNFAFRDYYKGVVSTNKLYLSQIIRSNATGHLVAAIAVPVHNKINGSLMGIWMGALNLKDMSQAVRTLSPSNELLVYLDQRGHLIVTNNDKKFLQLSHGDGTSVLGRLVGFNDGMSGKSGHTIETINGVKTFVAYAPIDAVSTKWVVVSLEPLDQVFLGPNSLSWNAFWMNLLIGGTAGVFIFLLNRSFRSLNRLTAELTMKERELRKTNEELQMVERGKDEFMSMINHELKTPLVPIKGYTDMLTKPKVMGELNEKQKKAVSYISYNIGKLELLVSDILDVYKLDMGRLKLVKKDVEVEKLIITNIFEFKRLADQKNVEIIPDLGYQGLVYCDQRRIDQVITNLIKNALDFVPADTGRIILRVSKKEEKLFFSVEDNGPGIPLEKIDSLFKKFYQIDTSISRKHGGTGLGLAISKGIIEAHGGEIWVDRSYTAGAKFVFTLPLKADSK